MKVRIVKFNEKKEVILNQEELALKIEKHRSYISRMENGEDMRISNLLLLSEAIGLKLELKFVKSDGFIDLLVHQERSSYGYSQH